MGLTITLMGLVHGLVFLPVLLTYLGPRRNPALYEQLIDNEKTLVKKAKMSRSKMNTSDVQSVVEGQSIDCRDIEVNNNDAFQKE